MKMTTSWAFASAAVVAILVAGCTTETADSGDGGTTTGTSGTSTGGSAGAGGSGSTAGSAGTGGGMAGAGGSAEMMSACETCAYSKCNKMKEVDNCEADTMGCGARVDAFYDCISKAGADETGCSTTFVTDANGSDAGGDLANELASCMVGAMGCLDACQGGGSDAGHD